MGNVLLNESIGVLAEHIADGGGLIFVPMASLAADGTVRDAAAQLDTFLAVGGNSEQTAGNWNRKTVAAAAVNIVVDDTGDKKDITLDNELEWDPGPATGSNVTDLLMCLDGANDGARRVVAVIDFVVTANDQIVATDGFTTTGIYSGAQGA